MQSKKNAAIIVLAILVVALAILLYMTNADKNRLADTSAGLTGQAESLSGEKEGWTAFSMANDWSTIYGEGVEKVGLPGAEQEAEALPDAA